MPPQISQPLSNAQLEILRAFAHQLSEADLAELRQTLAAFFAQRAIAHANQAWDNNGWTDTDVDRLLATKLRRKPSAD